MKTVEIGITAWGSISPLGTSPKEIYSNYLRQGSSIKHNAALDAWTANIIREKDLENFIFNNKKYRHLDRSVLLALFALEKLVAAYPKTLPKGLGINVGSSRGATTLFEDYYNDFVNKKNISPRTSPSTTLGNLASTLGQHINSQGISFSHSITCSTALHAILNGVAWIKSNMATSFIVGGAEAPLTQFTIAQMKALGVYSQEKTSYPCRPLDFSKEKNTMVLGEGAALFLLEPYSTQSLVKIENIGYATETISHATALSPEGTCLQSAMRMALNNQNLEEIDVIITHSPGTLLGDSAEYKAIQSIFGNNIPLLTNNKWKIGHLLGASGALSIEMAILMLLNNNFLHIPYLKHSSICTKEIKKILINAVGFGGNAVSLLLVK